MSRPTVAGEPAADRLMRSLDYRLSDPGMPRVSPQQVAVVLHALADHTALMAALDYRRDDASPWPESLSLGRWLHDTADDLRDRPDTAAREGQQREAIKAEALREAASAMWHEPESVLPTVRHHAAWLRDRAAALAPDADTDGGRA